MSPRTLRDLVARFGSYEAVVAAVTHGKTRQSSATRSALSVSAEERRASLEDAKVRWIADDDPSFPRRLANRPDRPPGLFIVGEIATGPTFAVVGTRTATTYGRNLATAYGEAIANEGWSTVSGLARGVDGAAHKGTVRGGGHGCVVLGSGVDVLYPPEHRSLARQLVDSGGAVVSEYPLGADPRPWRFPPRNRIISALADAVIVVEADVKGGALITASLALDQGVPVFAVPGDVNRRTSRGCNLLIRDGAFPALDPDELIEDLRLLVGAPPKPKSAKAIEPAVGWLVEAMERVHPATIDNLVIQSGRPVAEVVATVGEMVAAGDLIAIGDTYIRSQKGNM
ncbi:MAG: DNA-protecting protein DprA [Acidobacteria bacterium]|nr:DNA-protecting protein DprA [Acidobacteriota bacterium]